MFRYRSQCLSRPRTQQQRQLFTLLVFALCLFTSSTRATLDQASEADPMKYCGMALNEILDNICLHGYRHRLKRSVPLQKLSIRSLDDIWNFDASFKENQLKWSTKSARSRRLASIITECCKHGCVYSDIASYCNKS